MENFVADIYQKSIYVIDYQRLVNRGIKCLLFDLDNTLVPPSFKRPTKKVKDLFDELKKMGFQVIILSNASYGRVKKFREDLEVDGYSWARKPKSKKFLKILEKYRYEVSEVAIIGDQIVTDVLGGNSVGITTVLVNPLSPKEKWMTKINRSKEKRVLKKLRDNGLFTKGKYYEE